MQNKENSKVYSDLIGTFLNLFLAIGSPFYKAWLVLVVWDWFLADKFFDLTYWGMFFGLFILKFFTSNHFGNLETKEKIDFATGEKVELPVWTVTKNLVVSIASNTFTFGIIWLVYVIIN